MRANTWDKLYLLWPNYRHDSEATGRESCWGLCVTGHAWPSLFLIPPLWTEAHCSIVDLRNRIVGLVLQAVLERTEEVVPFFFLLFGSCGVTY